MRFFLLSFVLLHLSVSGHCKTCTEDAEVLILGGGMAGVSAANRLNELGVTNFIILESQDRLGGRLRTEEIVPGLNLSIGANWIHGVDPNNPRLHPIYDLAERCGGLQGVYTNHDDIITYDHEGNQLSLSDFRYEAYESAFSQALKDNGGDIDNDLSVREGLTKAGWIPGSAEDNFVEWHSFDSSFSEKPDVTSIAGIHRLLPAGLVASPALSIIAGREFVEGNNAPLHYFITDRRGYPYLIQCMANNFSSDPSTDKRIHLNTIVTRIKNHKDCVCATATTGNSATQYCAPYAIVTFSVEVLRQKGSSHLFSPTLSKAKRNALDFIRMGFYYIIITEFEREFWDDNQFIGHVHPTRGYFPMIIPVHESFGINATAVHVTDELAFRLAGLSDEEVMKEITQVHRNIYGDDVPAARNVIRMSWGVNPSFLGSFSNVRPNGAGMVKELQVPEGRLYIAGEGTSIKFRSSTHGAFLSGIQTANSVVKARSVQDKNTAHCHGNFCPHDSL